MRRRAGVIRWAPFAAAAATTAVRRHHEQHLVHEEGLQLPPTVDAKQLRADLRPVYRRAGAIRWASVVATVRRYEEQ